MFVVRLDRTRTKVAHRELYDRLREAGIGVNLHYIPVHTQPYYRSRLPDDFHLPEAESYYAEAISLPMYATISDEQQDEVVAALRTILEPRSSI